MTVNQMTEVLAFPAWLERDQVKPKPILQRDPVAYTPEQTPLVLDFGKPPMAVIFITIDGKITTDDLYDLLTGGASPEAIDSKGMLKVTDFWINTIEY